MKKYLLFASAVIALASCTTDTYIGDQDPSVVTGEKAINFSSGLNAITRADKTGADAAADLNGKFYVWGIKNENKPSTGDGIGDASAGNLVYNNYVVEWADNSAMTSTSNTEGWEYVGKNLTAAEAACITTNGGSSVTQTIKYWDFGASDYTFYAFTADPSDLNATVGDAKVRVAKTKSVTTPKTVYDKGYTVTLAAGANLDKLYFSERVNIGASANTERTQDNTYGGNVTFRFHSGSTKVRVAMYETIPGYKVTIDKFLVDNDGTDPAFSAMTDEVTANFAANLQYSPKGVAGTMAVTYNSVAGTTQNWPILTFTPTAGTTKVLTLGTGLAATVDLGTSITAATYDKTDDPATTGVDESYTSVFPNETNSQNLKLKVNYTLTAVDNSGNATTGETIKIEGATAEIPAAYLQWKPGFAYTYIFKISDNTNGSSGQGVVGLYPITFDAVEVIAADGKAEYITTVSEPSITTLGVKGGAYSVEQSEYASGTDVYATVVDGSSVAALTKGTNIWLYTVTATSPFTVTEAGVAEHLVEKPTMTKAQVDAAKVIPVDANSSLTIQNTVPREDDVTEDKTIGTNMVGKFTTATGTKYAIVYMKTAPTYYVSTGATYANATEFATAKSAAVGEKLYNDEACTSEAAAWTDASTTYYQINGKTYTSSEFTAAGTLYTNAACTIEAESWVDGTKYYKPTRVKTNGVYAIKIVNCP